MSICMYLVSNPRLLEAPANPKSIITFTFKYDLEQYSTSLIQYHDMFSAEVRV
jgi:hypothetical protein